MSGPRVGAALGCMLAIFAAAALAIPTRAMADGDPASDYLYTRSTFTPAGTPTALNAQLARVVAAANHAGEPIKVAVIGSPYDLGSITPLWKRPTVYARFLGIELSIRFHGILLVVMPNGFGVYHHGRPVARQTAAIAHLQPGKTTTGLISSAGEAVRMIAAADQHPVVILGGPTESTAAARTAGRRGPIALAVGLLCVVAVVAAWIYSLRRQPLARRWTHPMVLRSPWLPRTGVGTTLLCAIWLMAAAGITLVGIKHFALSSKREALQFSGGRPTTWKPGAYAAPPFLLHDQNGKPISVDSSHGRVTIIAFLDPTCRNLCPEEASILGSVERRLGTGRVPIVAVSVDPWGQQHARLLRDIRDWRVGPAWNWAIGTRAALQQVWADYKIGVKIKRLHVGGVTVHEVFHDELIYILDSRGDIRALYPYPFRAAQVVSTVRSLQS